MKKSAPTFALDASAGDDKKSTLRFAIEDPTPAPEPKTEGGPTPLVKSILNILNGGQKDSVERLAFETDPSVINQYHSVYKAKLKLIPDTILKRIAIQDDLVATIVQARSHQMTAFGRPRPDRFSTGFVIEPNVGVLDKLDAKQKEELDTRLEKAIQRLNTCGETKGWSDDNRCTFAQWLHMSTRNAVVVGRLATEIIWVTDPTSSQKRFHSFRPIDAGTIFRATPQKQAADSIRKQALHILQSIKNKKLIPEKFENDEYSWVQVIEGRPYQAFTSDECVVHNFYPVADVELDGYPVTPIDTMLSAVTTHINITTHNKLYFQSGRAARGMLVIKSDDVDEGVLARIKQQFNASINSVNNSHRMPVFAVATTDEITWEPIDNSSRDMEFQYLTDMNARVILSAFQMSPEELPGWSYLSRGTNNQALSESNNEYRIEAARDLGIRPLIANFEDFLNTVIYPLIDPTLAKLSKIKLIGLDAETAEKESVRLQQDMPVHMTYNEVMEKTEKKPISRHLGGDFPLNPQFGAILDKYVTVGVILEDLFGIEGASKDPSLTYFRDPFWFQQQQLDMQKQMQQMQLQQVQQQMVQGASGQGQPNEDAPQQPGVSDTAPAGKTDEKGGDDKKEEQPQQQPSGDGGQDLTSTVDQLIAMMSKSEQNLPPSSRRLLAQQKRTVKDFLAGFDEDLREATKEILAVAEHHTPKKKN